MSGFEMSEWIACPPQRVFEFITDSNNAPKIVPSVKSSVKLTEGPPKVGTRYRETRLMGGKEQHAELEVSEYAEPELYAMRNVTDGIETVYRYKLHPERDGTRINLVCEIKAAGIKKLMLPLVASILKKEDGAHLRLGEGLPLVLPAAAGGLALAVAAPGAIIAMARRHGRLAQTLLGPTATREHLLAGKVEELRESRARLLDAALTERRRIERDLHDGAQQRLVAVAMGLGRAREKMKTDPEAAATLVAEAHEQTKLAIRDIRELVRGIHPAVLGDRGLDAALSALAGRSPVPIRVDVTLDHRPPEAIEATAYFVAAEALTNIARHSRATHAWVSVSCANGRLKLEIGDDGAGGAVAAPGGGLAGLADRVAALGGRFAIASPPGGPTRIEVDLPCE